MVKTAVKKIDAAMVTGENVDKEKMAVLYKDAVARIAKTSAKGTLHKRTASRMTSRLALSVNKVMGKNWLCERPSPTPAAPVVAPDHLETTPDVAATESVSEVAPVETAIVEDAVESPVVEPDAETSAASEEEASTASTEEDLKPPTAADDDAPQVDALSEEKADSESDSEQATKPSE